MSPLVIVLLVVLILFLLGGWGFGRSRGGSYGNPMGLIGLILVVLLVVVLVRGGL
jgi:hypothetical protein